MKFVVQRVYDKTEPDDDSEFEAMRNSLLESSSDDADGDEEHDDAPAADYTYADLLRFITAKPTATDA